jgi:Na+/proline symporter
VNVDPAKTPLQEEVALKSQGQRKTNDTWERTQSIIALTVVMGVLIGAIAMIFYSLRPEASERLTSLATIAFGTLSSLASLVIGFYFGRTNHTKTGGADTSTDNER